MKKTDREVLLVIDVQNDFCPGGALAVPQGDEVILAVNRLAASYAHVILTQDWHPRGHSSFASSHPASIRSRRSRFPMASRSCGRTIAFRGRRERCHTSRSILPTPSSF